MASAAVNPFFVAEFQSNKAQFFFVRGRLLGAQGFLFEESLFILLLRKNIPVADF
jgi:hypothetical protein